MGWCHEFGVEIEPSCAHPMTARSSDCACPECGTVCQGRFEGGCAAVWRRGPRLDAPARPSRAVAHKELRTRAGGHQPGGDQVNGSAPPATRNGSPAGPDESERVREVQGALANLAEQVARQTRHLAVLEGHISDLGRVLGQLGVEVDERIGRLEATGAGVPVPPPEG
ncbi:MAG TPA: hypothetical protein VNT56_03835 [Acidimicrobiales bacterium]|nr:hypothetical protein [Acidimicrobiales bacterium]